MRTLKMLACSAAATSLLVLFAGEGAAATRVQKTFGNWKVDCTERENKQKTCALQYALVTKKDKRPVFSWRIIRSGKEGVQNKAVLRTPTGVLLSEGVKIGFQGAEPVKINYLTCGPNGCVAEFDFTDQWFKALGANQKVIIDYKAANQKPIKHEIELKQFGEAYSFYTSQTGTK